jgi:hypothetical protein
MENFYETFAKKVLRRAMRVAALRDVVLPGRPLRTEDVQTFIDAADWTDGQYDRKLLNMEIEKISRRVYDKIADRIKEGDYAGIAKVVDKELS